MISMPVRIASTMRLKQRCRAGTMPVTEES